MKRSRSSVGLALLMLSCNPAPRGLPTGVAEGGHVAVGLDAMPPVPGTSVALLDAAAPVPTADASMVEDDGGVRTRSEVVIAEWFSTGGGPRTPPEGGFDFSERAFADGRYEMRSDSKLESTKDMHFVTKKVPKIYRPVHQLTRVEMEAFEALVKRTVEGLAPRYEESSTDRGVYRFVFRVDGKEYRTEVLGHLQDPTHPLTAFRNTFQTLHKERTKRTESVRAWTKSGAFVERSLDCSMSAMASLSPLTHIMFPNTNAKPARPPATKPAPDILLLDVRYLEDGKVTDTYRVTGNGRVSGIDAAGKKHIDAQLTPEETQALVVTLEDIDWSALSPCR